MWGLPPSPSWEEGATNFLSPPVAMVAAVGGWPEEEAGKGKAQSLEPGPFAGVPHTELW